MPPIDLMSRIRAVIARNSTLLGAAALILAALAVYGNSFGAPFVFDDVPAVERNPTITHLWPPWKALNPPIDGSGVTGRPLVNLSLAIDYAVSGLDVRGYHATNLTLHILVSLLLWGVIRRTVLAASRGRAGAIIHATGGAIEGTALETGRGLRSESQTQLFAWSVALLWTVHPLLTESVVCVVQRTEILGSLFYVLTLYCFIRGSGVGRSHDESGVAEVSRMVDPRSSRPRNAFGVVWLVLSFFACLAGVLSKEIIVSAPLLVFLHDRTFVAGTFRAGWRKRRIYYVALVATWLPLAALVWHNRQRGGTAGFGHVTSVDYLLTQCRALALYLKLALWPHPLVLDYGWWVARGLGDVTWQALLVFVLLVGTVVALMRKPVAGFLGASFFLILAPSSSFVPLVTQTIAEHRMYLPLAAVLGLLMACVHSLIGRGAVLVGLCGALVLGVVTVKRNQDYRTEIGLWTDTVSKCPGNARAHGNLGRACLKLGRWEEAIAACRRELSIDPGYNGDARVNIGRALTELGRPAEAVPYFEAGLRLRPDSFDVHNNYGIALSALGRMPEAVEQYEAALRLQPDFAEVHNNLGNALAKAGRLPEAVDHYEAALRLQPDFVTAEVNLGHTLVQAGRLTEAVTHFEKILRAHPGPESQADLANVLAAAGRMAEAIPHYESALRLQPDKAMNHLGLGNALARLGNYSVALAHFEDAVRLQPELAEAQHNLGETLMQLDRPAEAVTYFEETARLLPGSADAHHELALILGQLHRLPEAGHEEETALRLRPDFAEAREHLVWLRQQ